MAIEVKTLSAYEDEGSLAYSSKDSFADALARLIEQEWNPQWVTANSILGRSGTVIHTIILTKES